MNKTELINAIAEKTGFTKADTQKFVNSSMEVIEETLVKGDKIGIVGFGTLEVRNRSARTGRNPKTKEEISIPASKSVGFKAGATLKESLNK